VPDPKNYKLVLDTDAADFDGFGRVAPGMVYPKDDVPMYGQRQSIRIYLPARSAQVLAPV
jgi:hypothetical protein